MKKLNFGCGNDIKPKKEGWINVDIQRREGIDFSFDFEKFPYPFKNNTFDYVLIDNVLEHIRNPHLAIQEIWRICKKDAIIKIIVPYYNSYYAYADPTHVNFFNEKCIKQTILNRVYEDPNSEEKFEIIKLRSIPQRFFKYFPKSILNIMKRFLGNVIVTLDVEAKVLK
jgi:SAM-dependent methyltransferase